MRSPLKISGFVLASLSIFSTQVLAYLPEITFEQPQFMPYSPVDETTHPGWDDPQGAASITAAGQGFGGGQALKIAHDPNEEGWIKRAVDWDPSETVAFIDFRIKPAANPEGSLADFFANGTQIAFQVAENSSSGEVWVLHGNDAYSGTVAPPEQWYRTNGTFAVAPGGSASSEWIRLTLRHDYGRNIWDAFVNGKFVAANLGFDGRGTNLEELDFFGSLTGDALIDNVSADPDNMLFPDNDKDGLPNDWEVEFGSDPDVYDRDEVNPLTGKSYLDQYFESLWSAGTSVNGATGSGFIGNIPPLSILGSHRPVGSLKGSLSVAGDGSASYSVPIDVPKGTAGMEPKLSLEYSSNGSNGIAGLGWSLSGLQQIIRGGSAVRKDGTGVGVDGVDFDEKDRFFFDGQRLVCTAGTYGYAGSEYRTEIDSFARFKAYGTGLNVTHWTVETQSGLVLTLGNTADSKVSESRGVLSWSVNKVEDTVGNYYEVIYSRDAAMANIPNDVHNQKVARINYTGAPGKAPYCSVYFDYETRPDKRLFYTSGLSQLYDARLSCIRVETGTHQNHRYELGYRTSHQTGRSLLVSVTKIGEGGELPPTTFEWRTVEHDEVKWKEADKIDEIVGYANSDWDSRDGLVGQISPVNNEAGHVHLTGVVWRALPFTYTVTANTWLEFEYKPGTIAPSYAMIALDEDLATGAPNRMVKVIGSGNPPGSGVMVTSPYAPGAGDPGDGYDKMTIHVGSYFTGTTNYLVMVNDDVNLSDGQGESYFRNIRVYNKTGGVESDIKAPVFDLVNNVPQMVNNQGGDMGLRLHDFTGDGRADLLYRIFRDKSGGAGNTIDLDIYGQTLKGTLSGFETVPITTQQNLVTGIRGSSTDAPWAGRVDLPSIPVDIDSDGRMDFCYAKQIHKPGTYSTAHWHGFMSWDPATNTWVDKPGYTLPFKSVNNINYHRFNHFEFADLDGDGYQDLLVHLNTGELQNASGTALSTTGSAWMNRVAQGQGWVRNDSLKLPKTLKVIGVARGEVGRRIFDTNGDGLPDFIQSRSVEAKETWLNTGTGFVQQSDNRYHLPIYLTNGDGDDVGARLVDLNGDGLTDAIKDLAYNGVSYATNAFLNTGYGWQVVADGAGGIAGDRWTLPDLSLAHFDKYEENHTGQSSMVDVNGDGLVDLVVARWNATNRIYFNTGTGWWASDSGPYWADGSTLTPSKYHLPEPIYRTAAAASVGKAVGTFADVDGDGVADYISDMDQPQPRVWINQCGPEIIEAVTDGFGRRLEIEYGRLNDPVPLAHSSEPAYLPGTGALPAGHVSALTGARVVTRLREPDGAGGWRGTRRHYADFRYDRINEAALGFGRVEVHDEHFPAGGGYLSRAYTVTETMREYPFVGSPSKIESYVNIYSSDIGTNTAHLPGLTAGAKRVSLETATYGVLPYIEGQGGLCQRPVQTGGEITKYDLFGNVISWAATTQTFDHAVLSPFSWVWNGTKRVPDNPASDAFHGKPLATRNSEAAGVFAQVVASEIEALDGSQTLTENTYDNITSSGDWHLGRLRTAAVTKSAPGKATITKTTAYTYDPDGLLATESVEPGSSDEVETLYFRDSRGNVIETQVHAQGGPYRWKKNGFDGNGRFAISEESGIGTIAYSYDESRALLESSSDIDGRVTTFGYDAFGTNIATNLPDGTSTAEITWYANNNALPADVRFELESAGLSVQWARSVQASGTPSATVYLDTLGREVATSSKVLASYENSSPKFRNQYTVTVYDARGRKVKSSSPFFAGDSIYWTSFLYDPTDRIYKTVYPDNKSETLVLLATEGTATVPLVHTETENKKGYSLHRYEDQHGRLVRSSDESGQTSHFNRDAEGRLESVYIGTQRQITNTYDILGRKTQVDDVSAGISSTAYNGFGDPVSVTTAAGTTFTEYDGLGRVSLVKRPGSEGHYKYYYHPAGSGNAGKVWKVEAVDASGAALTGTAAHREVTTYDAFGRVTQSSKTQFGETAVGSVTYNALGLINSETDAGGLQVIHDYDGVFGSFKVRSRIASPSTTIWQFGSVEVISGGRVRATELRAHGVRSEVETEIATGRILKIYSTGLGRFSNGPLQNLEFLWDDNGNLTWRKDWVAGKEETFEYDSLDRLTKSQIGGNPAVSYGYDAKGNLTSKGAGESRTYQNGASPYRVSSATVKGTNRTYGYDGSGRVVSDGKRSYTWASTDQLKSVSHISALSLTTVPGTSRYVPEIPGISLSTVYQPSLAHSSFEFNSSGSRVRQTLVRDFQNTSAARCVTDYFGSYEREQHAAQAIGVVGFTDAKAIHRHQLGSAVYTRVQQPGLADSVRLAVILTDHIGSTDVIVRADWDFAQSEWKVAGTEPRGERQSFDAWGDRRDADSWAAFRANDAASRRTSSMDYDRGFTGHEMLDDFGLVHMNGRIYDAELGRFLSPDPFVQVPEYSQNFNRYSYVLNNPLSYTDPSGHFIGGLHIAGQVVAMKATDRYLRDHPDLAQAVNIVVTVVLSIFTDPITAGAVGGALNARAAGGDFGDVAKGAAIGALQGAVCQYGLHELGVSAQGSVKAAIANPTAGTIATAVKDVALHSAGHALVGGAASAGMGGKFQDGFLSAAVSTAAFDLGISQSLRLGESGDFWDSPKLVGDYARLLGRTAVAAVIGGTASAVGGGKFANGAYTAAFQHLANDETPRERIEVARQQVDEEITASYFADGSVEYWRTPQAFNSDEVLLSIIPGERAISWLTSKFARPMVARMEQKFAARAAARLAAAEAAKRISIYEGQALLAVVGDGKILRSTFDVALSHAEFVKRNFRNGLPEGALVVTIGKHRGQIFAQMSATYNNGVTGLAPHWVTEMARKIYK